jgi:hypothetical protein
MKWFKNSRSAQQMKSASIAGRSAEPPVYISFERTGAVLKRLNCSWIEDYGPASIWQTARGFRFTVEKQCEERSWQQILSGIANYL